jgi:HAD superfamily hydrolase (TIGR01458 family)
VRDPGHLHSSPATDVRGLLVDIDGVLAVSWEPIAGAIDALARLRAAAVPVVFVTNTTSIGRRAVAERLERAGFSIEVREILTAPVMTAAYLRREHPGARCAVIGEGDVIADLDGVSVVSIDDEPDVVVVAGGGPSLDYAHVNRAFQLAVEGVPLVAMHRNLSWATDAGLQLDSGAFLAGIERAAHVEAVTIGKPSPACFAAGLELLGLPSDEVAMVGDDLDADVLGAQAVGITGVLVRTGKFRPESLVHAATPPDLVVDSLADVPAHLGLAP